VDFKVTVFLKLNVLKMSYTYGDRLTGSRIWSIEWCHLQWPWM